MVKPKFVLSVLLGLTQTVSAGVAGWDSRERALELLQRADAAMKEAKTAGRNRCLLAVPIDPPDDPPDKTRRTGSEKPA